MTMNYRIRAIHPATGEIKPAIYKEDWFGEGLDAIQFDWPTSPNFNAKYIEWEFIEEGGE